MPSSSHTGSAIYGDAPITATYLPLLFATAHVSTGKSVWDEDGILDGIADAKTDSNAALTEDVYKRQA